MTTSNWLSLLGIVVSLALALGGAALGFVVSMRTRLAELSSEDRSRNERCNDCRHTIGDHGQRIRTVELSQADMRGDLKVIRATLEALAERMGVKA